MLKPYQKILKERQRLLRDMIHAELLASDDKDQVALAGRVRDSGEQSVADLFADLEIASLRSQVAELADIEAALRRIADGTYGVCIDCGGAIAPKRLEIYPTAKRCVTCQARKEHRARDTTPSL